MSERKCTFKAWVIEQKKWCTLEGVLLAWGVDSAEDGGNYSCGICETPDGKVWLPRADTIQFIL